MKITFTATYFKYIGKVKTILTEGELLDVFTDEDNPDCWQPASETFTEDIKTFKELRDEILLSFFDTLTFTINTIVYFCDTYNHPEIEGKFSVGGKECDREYFKKNLSEIFTAA